MYQKLIKRGLFLLSFSVAPLVWAGEWVHENSDVAVDPAVTWGELENGFRYALMHNEEPPKRLSMRLYVDAGSLMEREKERGLAHFLEHMAFNGSENFAPGELDKFLQRIGMQTGADSNAYTGFDQTVYMLNLPENNEEMIRDGLRVMSDYAGKMSLLEKEIDAERGIILSEKRDRDSVEYRVLESYLNFAFGGTLVSKRLPIGLESVIQGASRKEFVNFYNAWYRPERIVLFVVGDFDTQKMEGLLKEYFATMASRGDALPGPVVGTVSGNKLAIGVHEDAESPAMELSMFSIKPYTFVDNQKNRAEQFQRRAAYWAINKRFERIGKQEKAPFISASASSSGFLKIFEMPSVDGSCQPGQWREALTAMDQELRRALEHGFTPSEFNEYKADLLNGAEQAVRSEKSRKSAALVGSLLASVSEEYVFNSPEQDLEETKKNIGGITPEACLAVLRKDWAETTNRFIWITTPKSLDCNEATVKALLEESADAKLKAPEDFGDLEFFYTGFAPEGKVVSVTYDEELDIYQCRFANEVRLNLKKTDFQKDLISVGVRFGAGELELPEGKPGLVELAGSVYTDGGLGKHDQEELNRIFAGKTVGVGFAVGEDSFALGGGCSVGDFEDQLKLMCAYLIDPGYRDEAIWQAHRAFEEMYPTLKQTLEGVASVKVGRFISGGNERFGFPKKEELFARTLKEVAEWLKRPRCEGFMEISVVGDFKDNESVIKAIANTFGALPKREAKKGAYEEVRKLAVFPKAQVREFAVESEIPKAMVLVYWPTVDEWNILETRRLGLLSSILSNRLEEILREEMGDVYSPFASASANDVYKDYGTIYGGSYVGPKDADRLSMKIAQIAKDMAEKGVTQDELDRAKRPLMKRIEQSLRSNAYWASVLAKSQEYPVLLDWAKSRTETYATMSVQDMNETAKGYLKEEKVVRVHVLPESFIKAQGK